MVERKSLKIINFFDPNKFRIGLVSFIYCIAIVFFILLAIILSLKKYGKIRVMDLLLIGLPALVLIVLVLVLAETGRWWLFPHWLLTSFKRAELDGQKREIHFITGFWPLLFNKKYSFDFIDSLVLTSRTRGDFGREDRFGLKIKFKNNDQWTFFNMFKGETELRTKVKDLSQLLGCQISDNTYGSPSPINDKRMNANLHGETPVKHKTTHQETDGDTESTILDVPKGIKEKKLEDGGYLFLISKRHEWLAFICLIGIWTGIYVLTWILGWTSPGKPGTWRGIWLFFTAILILFSIKTFVPVKKIRLDKSYLYYRFYLLGIPVTGKKIPITTITRITRQQIEIFSYRLVIISDQQTLKVNNLDQKMAGYLEEKLSSYLLRRKS